MRSDGHRASRRAGPRAVPRSGARGITLPETLIALLLLAVIGAVVVRGFDALDRISLGRSADLAAGHLQRARLEALARRELVAVRTDGSGRLLLLDARGRVLGRLDLAGDGLLALDSIRVRPTTIRYNPRGHGSPGSVTLYRGRRGIRLVSNFVGRVRRHGFRF